MGIQNWSDDVILAELAPGLREHGELQTAIDAVRSKGQCDVVVDFSNVDIVGSPTFSKLLELRKSLQERGRKLVLCGVRPAVKGVFTIARLDDAFEFAADRFAALANVQMMAQPDKTGP